jgi:cell division protein FtsI (penicillin-binding protein 3)
VSTTTHGGTGHRAHSARLRSQPTRKRLVLLLVFVVCLFALVVVRLTQLQILGNKRYNAIGDAQSIHSVKLSADRGSIFDRNGHDLALSVPQQTIWADPSEVKDPYKDAALLAPILNSTVADLGQKLSEDGRFTYLARTVDDATAAKVKALKLAGISMYEEPKRFLPGDPDLSSVIGQVGVDGDGLSGLENQYNKQLNGKPGSLLVEQDPTGTDIAGGERKEQPAVRGDDLELTLDGDLQNKVEQSLSQEITLAHARGGIAAVMDSKTGQILALSNLQVPNGGVGSPVQPAPNNMALTNVYEPGSVSKLITMSAALQQGIVSPSTHFQIPDQKQVSDTLFHDADPHPVENWTTTDILAASSNIGTITIGQKLGKDELDKYQRAFGYGSETALKYPGESAGLILDPKHYSGTSLATSSIGQGVSVTAMQMLAAYNTIANNGTYVAPKLVKGTIDAQGKEHDTPPSATRQVVTPQVAKQMNLMLQEVVRVGTATSAEINGYDVAGKTGTARKPRSDGLGYANGQYISTFAGFVPAENPKFTAIVILDQPTPIYGGLVAAPVFADFARYALQEYDVPPATSFADRDGVPYADPSASSAADESVAVGSTAASADQATAAANAGESTSSTTSTTVPSAGGSSSKTSTTSKASSSTSTTEQPSG